jgi:hypothetical protein
VAYFSTAVIGGTAVRPSCSPASGTLFPFGKTVVTCTATLGRFVASKTLTVVVQDTTKPVITGPGDISTTSPSVSYTVTVQDTVDDLVQVGCSPTSPVVFTTSGKQAVTCTATDSHKNQASLSFTITYNPGQVG